MKFLKFLITGVFFGIVLTKGQVISWYRIQEMFLFDSFHMYGVIGSAVALGIIVIQLIKRRELKSINGEKINIPDKDNKIISSLIGGIIFGLGWSFTGACPGPIFILIGNGMYIFIVVLISALVGTFTYGILKSRLPH
jgi:uncharacterized membrane protein YedE/YeeE